MKADKHGNEHWRPRNKSKPSTPNSKHSESKHSESKHSERKHSDSDKSTATSVDTAHGIVDQEDQQQQGGDLGMDVGQGGQGDGRTRAAGTSMETTASAEEVNQREAQIKLLIRPTKFKLGNMNMCDRVLPPSAGSSDRNEQCTVVAENLAGGDSNRSCTGDKEDRVVSTAGDSMTVEPDECGETQT